MRIGITPYCKDDDPSQPYVPAGYKLGIQGRDAEMVVFYYTETNENLLKLLDTVDGFLFSGGPDVEPWRYGRERLPECGSSNPRRDEVEFLLFEEVMKRDMPVMAICRGIQMVNVGLGGTLVQHVPDHRQPGGYTYSHDLRLAPGSRLSELAESKFLRTNSYHHQCIDDLADSLVAVAWSDEGIIEAVTRPASRFFAAYQWHPECLLQYDKLSNRLFDDFIEACAGN